MEGVRLHNVQLFFQIAFWFMAALTVFWCVMWSVHHGTLTDPDPAETEQDRQQARQMVPLYLKHAALSGLVCLVALLAWKFS